MEVNFIQIGANVGNTDNDPLYSIVMKNPNWVGILVEPNPKAFKELVKCYKDCPNLYFENVAVSDVNGEIELYVDNYDIDNNGKGEGTSQHASCDLEVIVNRLDHPQHTLASVVCQSTTLGSLLDKYAVTDLAWLIIDTEGFDHKIILATDFSKYNIQKIQFEFIHMGQNIDIVDQYLKGFSYSRCGQTQEDFIYIKQ